MIVEVIGTLCMLAFLISSLTVGLRLLSRGARSHAGPELAIGAAFVVGGVIGYAPETVILSTDLLAPATEYRVLLVTQIAIRFAAASALLFTLLVFRRGQPIAWGIGALLVAGLVGTWFAYPQTRVLATNDAERFWYDAFTALRSLCIAWGSAESFLFLAKLQRRARIGIGADPVLVNRFRLWGIGLLAMTLMMASTMLAPLAGVDPASYGWVLLESIAGVIGATTIWLTFFPGERYLAWLRAQSAPAASAGGSDR